MENIEYKTTDTQPIYVDSSPKIMSDYENALYQERFRAEQRAQKILEEQRRNDLEVQKAFANEPGIIENIFTISFGIIRSTLAVIYSIALLWLLFITVIGGVILIPSAMVGREHETGILTWLIFGILVTVGGIYGAVKKSTRTIGDRALRVFLVTAPLILLYNPPGNLIFHR